MEESEIKKQNYEVKYLPEKSEGILIALSDLMFSRRDSEEHKNDYKIHQQIKNSIAQEFQGHK